MIRKWIFFGGLVLGVAACGHYVIVPPAVDLITAEPLGLITFSAADAKGDLDRIATQAFLEEITGSQRAAILELGKLDDVLAEVNMKGLDPDAARAIGGHYGIKSFFSGEVRISKVRPQVDLARVLDRNLRVRASFDIAVTGRLVSTETGATLWTNSSALNGTVGFLIVGEDGFPYFGMADKDEATLRLLRELMYELTWDFRPTRRRT